MFAEDRLWVDWHFEMSAPVFAVELTNLVVERSSVTTAVAARLPMNSKTFGDRF